MKSQFLLGLVLLVSPFSFSQIVINELDCDTPSTDDKEFVELLSETPNFPLDGYVIVFFNGFFLYFMFTSSFEHVSRLVEKFKTKVADKIDAITDIKLKTNDLAPANIGFKGQTKSNDLKHEITDNTNRNKVITNYNYEDLTMLIRENKKRMNAYKYKLRNNIGSEENNKCYHS